MVNAYIGLGSNLGDSVQNLRIAAKRLEECGTVIAKSRLYHTKPWGNLNQPDFTNGALKLSTNLEPRDLLKRLKSMEREIGRVESVRWGPRLIDLDILTYDDIRVSESDLMIPHLHMNARAFVLIPLCDMDETFRPALEALSEDERAEVQLSPAVW